MKELSVTTMLMLLLMAPPLFAQQVPDIDYAPPIENPAYASEKGPRVVVDQGHGNFHTVDGRYLPFAKLLQRDGYRVSGIGSKFSKESLSEVDILVVSNPLHESNIGNWSLPTPSAYTDDEIAAVHEWVEQGGSLLLIADHMPFPGAAGNLAKAFGAEFSNGYAKTGDRAGRSDIFRLGEGLVASELTRGKEGEAEVTQIATFGGSAFKLPEGSTPVLVFGKGSISQETTKAPGITPDAPVVQIEGWSQGAVLQVGKGRVAIFGEAAMFSAQHAGPSKNTMGMNAPEARQNYQLLLNVVHWLDPNSPKLSYSENS